MNEAGPEARSSASAPGAAYVADSINTASRNEIRVIIQLSGEPIAVGQYAARLGYKALAAESTEAAVQSEQDKFVRGAQSNRIPMKIERKFNTVLNGMEVTVRADQIPMLAKLPGVKSIHPNVIYYPADLPESYQTATGSTAIDTVPLKQIGVLDAWERGLTGKNLKVGVIDTGIDYLHPDLAGNYAEGGYDAINQDDDPYEDLPTDISEGSYHGTHVSGTIAGTASNPNANLVQKGVAYQASLYAYKVLGPDGGTSAQVIDGIEHAVEDKMDVINLSLGSDLEKDPASPDAIAVNNAVLAGVVAVVANGNAGAGQQYYYSMGSPASAPFAISVGAVTSNGVRVSGSVRSEVGSMTEDARLSLMAWKTEGENFNEMFGTGPIQGVYAGLGGKYSYSDLGLDDDSVAGKVVFVSRGIYSFDEKVKEAAKHGAKAVIIFNGDAIQNAQQLSEPNLADDIPGRNGPIGPIAFLGDTYDYVPTFDMPGQMGRALARELRDNPGQAFRFTMQKDFGFSDLAGDRMADFSSRGPNSDGDYGIKPDLTAPGVQIFSTVPGYGANYDKAYSKLSGTSMATPHVAGLALLIKQAHPDWTPTDIRAALANTAETLSNEEGTQYDVYSQGAGRVNVIRAIDTRAIIESLDTITIYDNKMNPTEIPGEASSVSFGMLQPGAEAVKKPLGVKNLSDSSVAYNAKVVMHSTVTSDPHDPIPTPDPGAITVKLEGLSGNRVQIGAADSLAFNLSAAASSKAKVGVYEGEVLLESAGQPSLHLPFVIHVGKESEDNDFMIQDFAISSTQVSKEAPIDITASLPSGKVNHLLAAIYDMNNRLLGILAESFDMDEETDALNPLPSDFFLSGFSGSYNEGIFLDTGNNAIRQLPEGRYKVVLIGSVYNKDMELVDQSAAFKTFYMSEEPGAGTPDPGTGTGTGPYPNLPGPVKPAYNEEVASSVMESGQASIELDAQTSLQASQLSVFVKDEDLQAALQEAKSSVALLIGAASHEANAAQLTLRADQVGKLKEAALTGAIVFAWNEAAIALPLSAIEQAAAGADLVLTIKQDEEGKAEFEKQVKGAAVLGTPYVFEASAASNGVSTPLKLKADEAAARSFLIDGGIDASHAGALYLENGIVNPVPAKMTTTADGASLATIRRPGFSVYAAAIRQAAFTDIDKSWAQDQIQSLAEKFLVNGTTASTFSPKANVTRAQFASMLVRALGLSAQAAAAPFDDVKSGDWFASDVATAYAAGLVTGENGVFNPNAIMTRQDLSVMLARSLKLAGLQAPTSSNSHAYADAAKFGAYAKESIRIVTDAGLMKGVETKGSYYFHPSDPATREAAAKVIHDLLQASNRIR
ncbi:S8 family serine peptidase [Paenibacillus glycinis]|uniref:S8 family serine peptidase n=1 Tax=Paenibacillus glycinis TaxID=2697035 RepID=A0ABW9XKM8_9BACL|nr:S8 family serine peptidase [Paenibacillus glycinis]NBD23007.1 S8 family serine peptidase [Paenibacillus glycinis]